MKTTTTFYSASAGSGKTFTLARDILLLLIKNNKQRIYRNILAVTFTNMAVAEMKLRVLEYLNVFSKNEIAQNGLDALANYIVDETGIKYSELPTIAREIHQRILHDYSSFDIVTIDAFNHRLLQTFSRDLGLSEGFEVELDSDGLFLKAIKSLLSKVGVDQELTKRVVEFSIGKIDDNKSWNIEYDLLEIAKVIAVENYFRQVEVLKEKTDEDFLRFRESLISKIKTLTDQIVNQANQLLIQLNDAGLQSTDFNRGKTGSYGVIVKIADGNLNASPESAGATNLITNDYYKKSSSPSTIETISRFDEDIKNLGLRYREVYYILDEANNILGNLTSLSLLNRIIKEIEEIKSREQILPIYEFNAILANEIKNQPVPFIYERLGERYQHYFIDEFQDTSTMQWGNLSPLISNALAQDTGSGERGSLMLVGDAKQAIYRWRGGNADQFLELLRKEGLFHSKKKNQTLNSNWRSSINIVQFNNGFFEYYGSQLNHPTYKELYLKYLYQESQSSKNGYVQIDLLHEKEIAFNDECYPAQAYQATLVARQAMDNGFKASEICILTRTNAQAQEVSECFIKQGMKVISGDSLLVSDSLGVRALISFLKCLLTPFEKQNRFQFLIDYFKVNAAAGDLFNEIYSYLDQDFDNILKSLLELDVSRNQILALPLFQLVDKAWKALGFVEKYDTHAIAFMDFVHDFSNQNENALSAFLVNWEEKSRKLKVPAIADVDAFSLMTIHKSKGLEFPVVIVPYCEKEITATKPSKSWINVDPDRYSGFDSLFINIKASVQFYSDIAATLYQEQRDKIQMDHINTMYVAFTRAKENLYIIGANHEKKKSKEPTQASLLSSYAERAHFEVSDQEFTTRFKKGYEYRESKSISDNEINQLGFVCPKDSSSVTLSTKRGAMWSTGVDAKISLGNVIHFYLSKITFREDLERVKSLLVNDVSLYDSEQEAISETISSIVNNVEIKEFFSSRYQILTERAIMMENGRKLIPDRLMLQGKEAIILDYKTGLPSNSHKTQLEMYANAVIDMGYRVRERILVYTDNITIVRW